MCRMDQAGLTTTPFIKVTSIYVYLIQQNPDGTQVDSCNSAGTGHWEPAVQRRPVQRIRRLRQPDNGVAAATSRNVSTADANFGRLTINFTYNLIATSGQFSLSTSNVFRLEPQQ